MKILYYTDQTYKHGGIERVLSNKINYLLKSIFTSSPSVLSRRAQSRRKAGAVENQISLITTEQKNHPHCYPIDPGLQHQDLKINYHRNKSYFHPKNLIKFPLHYLRLRKTIKRIQPDIVITPHYGPGYLMLPFIYPKAKKIREFHSSRYFESRARKKNRSLIKKWLYALNDFIEKKYDKLIVLTPDEQQHFKSNNTQVIPNGITPPLEGSPGAVKSPLEGGLRGVLPNNTIISAGRIASVKGYEKLIKAWAIVNQKHPDWKLEIYGSGENSYVNKLQKQIDKLGLQEAICLCGQTDQMQKKMQESQAYVMSSLTECFPMVLLEAQVVGLPVISFDCPYGPKNIITHGKDGLLVENQNSDKLAEAIIQLIENTDLRKKMGKQAQLNVQKLNQENIMQQWITLFKQLIN